MNNKVAWMEKKCESLHHLLLVSEMKTMRKIVTEISVLEKEKE
jgi:hypothetical protein